MLKSITVAGLLSVLTLGASAYASDYPDQPIMVIIPSKAGGSTDTTARLFSEIAELKFAGYEFVISNMGGSGGQKGFEAIARARPNGYTIGMCFTPQLVAHIASGRADYTLDSFQVIGNVSRDDGILVVPRDSNYETLEEFVEAARYNEMTVAVNGIGSDDFLAAKSFEKAAGVTFNMLPTKGSVEQKTGIMGGHVDAAFMNLSQMLHLHKLGDARILALLSEKRDPSAATIPTAKEKGYDVFMTATRGFVTPAGVDKRIQDKLEHIVTSVLKDPEFQRMAADRQIHLSPLSGPEYLAYLKKLQAHMKSVYDVAPW